MNDDILATVKAALQEFANAGPTRLPTGINERFERAYIHLVFNAEDWLRDLVAEVERERIETAHLREAFVTMERAANQRETEVANAYDTIMNWEHTYRKDMDIALGERDRLQGLLVQSNTALEALRLRHAEAVEQAFREGRHTDRLAGDTEAWLASEARAALEQTP
jgi:hypothetical protein